VIIFYDTLRKHLDSMFERVIIFLRQKIEMVTENDSAMDEPD
jgi:hypothetical protein